MSNTLKGNFGNVVIVVTINFEERDREVGTVVCKNYNISVLNSLSIMP
jgi:hypothetical protein